MKVMFACLLEKQFSRIKSEFLCFSALFKLYITCAISAETDNCDKQIMQLVYQQNHSINYILNMLQYNLESFPFPSLN